MAGKLAIFIIALCGLGAMPFLLHNGTVEITVGISAMIVFALIALFCAVCLAVDRKNKKE